MGADEGDVWKGEKVGVKAVVGGRVEVMVVRKGKKNTNIQYVEYNKNK